MRIDEARSDKDLLEACRLAYQERKRMRLGFETQWWNNLALLAGDHYAQWDPMAEQFFEADNPDHRVRLVINHAKVVARTELAKLTKGRPVMTVLANSDEEVDIAAAKVGESILDALEYKFKLRKTRKDAYWWMIACGISAILTDYNHMDANDGHFTITIDPATGEDVFLPSRLKELKQMVARGELEKLDQDELPLGDVQYRVYSAFQLYPDPAKLYWRDVQDLIVDDIYGIGEIKSKYGTKAKDITPESVTLGVIAKRAMGRTHLTTNKNLDVRDANILHTFWLEPGVFHHNPYLVNGKKFVWCGSTILESDDFPFQDGCLPFAYFEHIPNAMSIWPDSILQDIRGPNLELDKKVSQIIEHADYMANPMWRVATQHQIKGSIKSRAGHIMRYTHVPNVPPPDRVEGVAMPQQVEQIIVQLREQILDISGQGEVSRGRQPSGVRSAEQLSYLQEEDETKLAPTTENIEDAIGNMGSQTLERISQFYTLSRTLRYYRRDGLFDVIKFRGADLAGNTDVQCQAGSALPRYKAARQQYVLQLVEMGVIQDPKQIKEMLELGEGTPDETDVAMMQANRENNLMMYGLKMKDLLTPPPPTSQDILPPDAQQQQDQQAPPDMGGGASPPGGVGGPAGPSSPAGPEASAPPGGAGVLSPEDMQTSNPPPTQGGPSPDASSFATNSTPTPADAHASGPDDRSPVAIPVKKWHKHEVHLKIHYNYMSTEEFDRLVKEKPGISRLFDEHTALHEQALQQAQQQQMAMMLAAKGAPEGAGAGAAGPSQEPPPDAQFQNNMQMPGGGPVQSTAKRRTPMPQ